MKSMQPQESVKFTRDVKVPDAITVQELANRMAERVADVVKSLMQNGIMATQNQSVDADTAESEAASTSASCFRRASSCGSPMATPCTLSTTSARRRGGRTRARPPTRRRRRGPRRSRRSSSLLATTQQREVDATKDLEDKLSMDGSRFPN